MKNSGISFQIAIVFCLGFLMLLERVSGATNTPAWHLIWSDEFDATDGSAPDPTKWSYDIGGNGWGNNELESYTFHRENSRIEGGSLIIVARKEAITGPDKIARPYTSARLKSKGKWSWTHGRIEARIKIPRGQGVWPAFWMLGANADTVGWPNCGEIDIMESIGREPDMVHGTVHGPGYSGGSGIGKPFKLPLNQLFASDFHLFAIEWETNRIRWSVDNQIYFTVTPTNLPAGKTWVFEKPEFLILNLAVGGNWPGNPDSTTTFPQQMMVDYVRVYNRTNTAPARLDLRKVQSEIEAQWPGEFPHAQLLRVAALGQTWQTVPIVGNYQSNSFIQPITPGFYRLSLQPK